MTANAEIDCNVKDHSDGESEGNILIFIREGSLLQQR